MYNKYSETAYVIVGQFVPINLRYILEKEGDNFDRSKSRRVIRSISSKSNKC